jgi:hypothetical protein
MVCALAAPRARAALSERSCEEPDSYKFDRRRGRRIPAPAPGSPPASMPATFNDGAGRFGVTSVEIVDAGPSGMGVRASCFVEPGMTLNLHNAGGRFPALTATVVRCEAREEGFSIGLAIRPGNRAA